MVPASGADVDAPGFEAASRFLTRAAFGGSLADIDALREAGLEGWFLEQLGRPLRSNVQRWDEGEPRNPGYISAIFWERAVHGEDQLRQRVALALSNVVVVSYKDSQLALLPRTFVAYTDVLQEEAFGNYEDLIRRVTYAPAMGVFLSHIANERADPERGSAPDENYARELMQLFTLGTTNLDEDGTARAGRPYDEEDVRGLAAVMTGLDWAGQDRFRSPPPKQESERAVAPMDAYRGAHETGPKKVLGRTFEGDDPIATIDAALGHVLSHANVPPYVASRLIGELVTSNPSGGYVRRVAEAYKQGRAWLPSGRQVGTGRRGDMTATIAAILFDEVALSPDRLRDPRFGRLREPTLRLAQLVRAFRPGPPSGPLRSYWPLPAMSDVNWFGEQPWAAPSVFGAVPPAHREGGSRTASEGLVAPVLAVTNAASVNGYLEYMKGKAWPLEPDREADAMTPDYGPLLAAADEPSALVDAIGERLLHGTMSAALRDRLVQAIGSIRLPPDEERRDHPRRERVQLAVLMAVTTSDYVLQR